VNAPELKSTVAIPAGASLNVVRGIVHAKGPRGEITKNLFHPNITITVENDEATIESKKTTKREKKMVYTFTSHLKNMVEGVTEGFEYKLKVCSGHFPMSVALKGEMLEVKNFLGEAVPRTLAIDKRTKVAIDGVVITVNAPDVEAAGHMAARIEMLCRRNGFDRRIFQDGIYITHKCGKAV
jgi:large subunit ribosomal protein L6